MVNCQCFRLLMCSKFRNHKNLLDCKFSKDYLFGNFLNFLLGRIVNDKRFHTKCVYDGLTGSQINSVGLVKAAQTISSGERPTFQNFGLEFFLLIHHVCKLVKGSYRWIQTVTYSPKLQILFKSNPDEPFW